MAQLTMMNKVNTSNIHVCKDNAFRSRLLVPVICCSAVSLRPHPTVTVRSTGAVCAQAFAAAPGTEFVNDLNLWDVASGARVPQHLYAGKKAVVVGAGPSGTLAAIYMAQQGLTVDVFEKRSVPRTAQDGSSSIGCFVGPHSFCIMLHRRGMEALEGAGIKLPPSMCQRRGQVVRYRGTNMYATEASPWSHSVNRCMLAGYLVQQAKALRSTGKINFHFEARLEAVSLADKTATFTTADGQKMHAKYDLLIGSDGANSRARTLFAEQVPGFSYCQMRDDMEYKTVLVPSLQGEEPAPYFTLFDEENNTFFVCARDASNGQTCGVYVMDRGGFSALKSTEEYEQALRRSFPAPFKDEHYKAMAEQLVAAPVSHGSLNTKCSQLYGPSAVLIGDAAHSMWPTLGQGVNSALEDAAVLSRVLKECKGDLSVVPKRFHNERHEDVVAVVDLTWSSYGKGRHAISAVSIVKTVLLSWAHKVLPWLFSRPALVIMNDTLMRYSEIKKMMHQEAKAVNMVLVALGAVVSAAALQLPSLLAPLLGQQASRAKCMQVLGAVIKGWPMHRLAVMITSSWWLLLLSRSAAGC